MTGPRALRRPGPIPHYVSRWYAECQEHGWQQDGKSREDAYLLAAEHDEACHDEPAPEPVCGCWPALHNRVEYEPLDCPIPDHKKKAQQ